MNPFKKRSRDAATGPAIILDTCALIDGRIVPIAKAGFVPRDVVIPQFVIAELQYLADNGDSQKRERARFGLDVIRELQDLGKLRVSIAREQFKNIKEVDDKLVALAKQYGSALYTTDYNLNKVAQIEGVHVLNVNELAQALRPPRLPGEHAELKITQVGQDRSQGVAYLDDGTMVVVEQAGKLVGQKVRVQFSRILQTQAGKMMFAVLVHDQKHGHAPQQVVQPKQVEQPRPQQPQGNVQLQRQRVAPPRQEPRQNQQQAQRPQPRQNREQQPMRSRRTNAEDSLLNAIKNQQQQ